MAKTRDSVPVPMKSTASRGAPIAFRPTQEERALVTGKAAEAGLTVSDFCRMAATGKTIYRNDNVPMELVGVMRSAGRSLMEALNEGRKVGFPPATMTALENAAKEMERAFRSIFHAP
jgi:uncharacterized protein (DUF1778 family)